MSRSPEAFLHTSFLWAWPSPCFSSEGLRADPHPNRRPRACSSKKTPQKRKRKLGASFLKDAVCVVSITALCCEVAGETRHLGRAAVTWLQIKFKTASSKWCGQQGKLKPLPLVDGWQIFVQRGRCWP